MKLKIWCVINDFKQKRFEYSVASQVFKNGFLNDYIRLARQVITTENPVFNLLIMLKAQLDVKITKLLKMERQFAVFPLEAYHGGIKTW